MQVLILFAVIVALIWTPHLYRGAVTRARYHRRSRGAYYPRMQGAAPSTPAEKLALFDACLSAHVRRER
jgi:hypothetical protein